MPHGVESLAGMCLGCPSDRTRLYALGLPLPSVRPLPPPDKDNRIRDGTPTHLDTQAGSSALLHLRLCGLCSCYGFLSKLSRRGHFFLVGSPRQIRGFLIPLPCRLFCFLEGLASLSPRLFATLQIPCSPPVLETCNFCSIYPRRENHLRLLEIQVIMVSKVFLVNPMCPAS